MILAVVTFFGKRYMSFWVEMKEEFDEKRQKS